MFEKNTEAPSQGSDRLIIGIVLGVLTYWLFSQAIVNIVSDIQNTFAITLETLNLAISLTALFSGCFIVVFGSLADKFGRVRFTYIGFILSIIGSLLLIIAQDPKLFIVGRIIQGLSAACIMPASLALIRAYYQGAARQRAISFWSFGSWGGGGMCSFVGGAIATYIGWQWIFIFSIALAILGMWLIKGTPESKVMPKEKNHFDYVGLVFFVIGLLTLNLLITKGSSLGWLSSTSIILFVVTLLCSALFFIIELKKADRAFIDFVLFKHQAYNGATLSNFMLNAVVGTLIIANLYLQQGRGFTAFVSGSLSLGYLISVLLMIRVGEKLLQYVGPRQPMLWGSLLTTFGIGLISCTFLSDPAYLVSVSVGFVFFGFGLGIYATPSTDTAVISAPDNKVGMASGIYKMASSLGGAFGIAISTAVYAAALAAGKDYQHAATWAFASNIVFALIALIAVIGWVPKQLTIALSSEDENG